MYSGLGRDEEGNKFNAMTSGFCYESNFGQLYKGIDIQHSFTDEGYIVEFKIAFVSKKTTDDKVGFDMIVLDCSNSYKDAEIFYSYTQRTLSYWNLEDTFPELTLIENKAVQ